MLKAVIIGAGPAGYTCAIRIAQLGGKVALIERDLVGGICINWGCTPSKAMISSAKVAKTVRHADEFGIAASKIEINFNQVAKRRDGVVSASREKIKNMLEEWGVQVIQGTAEMVDEHHVKVNDQLLEAENIVIATGSEPFIPPALQKEDESIVNSNRLITIDALPEELTIVGGGIIGLEFATIFANLGSKVRIVEFLDRVVATMDPEISENITRELTGIGVEILTGHKVLDIHHGQLTLERVKTGEKINLASALNLIAIGRRALMDVSGLERLGIAHTPKGVSVNEYLQTNKPQVYAIGDASGQSILAHVAIQQALLAAENMFGAQRKIDYTVIPAVVYTLPELASVGNVPPDLSGVAVVKFPFTANLRAQIEGHEQGFVKLWIKNKKLLAAQIIHEMAGEIIQSYANMIALQLDIDQIADIIHAHPTYGEIVRNSLEHALGKATEYKNS